MEGWIIDRDYGHERYPMGGIGSRVGRGQIDDREVIAEAQQFIARQITVKDGLSVSDLGDPVRFRLLSDDEDVDFGGAISRGWLNGDECLAFAPLNYAEADVGSTIMEYRNDAGEWVML